jgi:hypothetical protein
MSGAGFSMAEFFTPIFYVFLDYKISTSQAATKCWSIRQDSTSSDGNASQSQNECIGIISGSLYTQANKRGIQECMGENHEGEKGELMPREKYAELLASSSQAVIILTKLRRYIQQRQ